MPKAMRIKLTVRKPLDGEPRELTWTMGCDSRAPAGWWFRDHENYTRFSIGNWNEAVVRVREVADNYGCDTRIS